MKELNSIVGNYSKFTSDDIQLNSNKITQGNLHIYAIMVEFQPDSNRFTSGDGTFNPDYLDTSIVVIDPLPHDTNYFEAHLTFIKNYFETASKGRLNVSFNLNPKVYQLSKEMSAYSPTGEDNSEDFKLFNMLDEAWSLVNQDARVSTANWNQNTAFLVFHAGAGRDFNFLGTSLDKTPQDIPSLYANIKTLQDLAGNSNFSGFRVKGFSITNSGILPETESRTGIFLEEEFVLQLGINGLSTAIIGNHIGLPDLFNTLDGTSGIGRFGLMDPEGFFAFFGLFPPLPSAWERAYMEWDNPTEFDTKSDHNIQLDAINNNPASGIAKFSINAEEYFLIENRHRDPDGTGVELTIQEPDGTIITQQFSNSDTKFTASNLDSLIEILPAGTIINVSNFDYALPGGLDIGNDGEYFTEDDRNLNGGILIWHIDETVINQNLTSNRINANPDRRGVDLEEADGAQDIGQSTNNLFLQNVIGGHAFDFWWSGNNYTVISEFNDSLRLYSNSFSPISRPSTSSNVGGFVPFEFSNFSDNLATASFRFEPFEGDLVPDSRFSASVLNQNLIQRDFNIPFELIIYQSNSDTLLLAPSSVGLFALKSDGSNWQQISTAVYSQPIIYNNSVILATDLNQITSYSFDGLQWITNWTSNLNFTIPGNLSITSNLIDIERSEYWVNPSTGIVSQDANKSYITSIELNGQQAQIQNNQLILGAKTRDLNASIFNSNRFLLKLDLVDSEPVPSLILDNSYVQFKDTELNVDILQSDWPKTVYSSSYSDLAIFSVDDFGTLNAELTTGAFLPKFPFSIVDKNIIQAPLLADIDNDETDEFFLIVRDSLQYSLHAYTNDLNSISGFPISLGSIQAGTPINPIFYNQRLWTTTTTGFAQIFFFENANPNEVASIWGNPTQPIGKLSQLFSVSTSPNDFNSLLQHTETYNWPNPANENTHIRFQTREAATISIQIFTQNGTKIWQTSSQTNNAIPNEIELNTSNWGNGLYLARIKAKSATSEDVKIIKMVVEH